MDDGKPDWPCRKTYVIKIDTCPDTMEESMRPGIKLRSLAAIVLATLLLTATPIVTAAAEELFEGIIHMQMSGSGENVKMRYLIRPNMMRMEIESGGRMSVVIQDYGKKKSYNLMLEMKQYMELPMNEDGTMMGEGRMMDDGQSGEHAKEQMPVKTGKTEKIHGYDCEQYLMKDAQGTTEMWLAKDFSPVKGLSHEMSGSFFTPFRVITYDPSGKEMSRQEVTKIEKKKLADSLFKPPADYKKLVIDMPPGMRGMPGGGY